VLSKCYVLKGGWFDPGDFHFRLSFLSPTIDFSGPSLQSVTVIHKVDLDKIRIVNCMFLPSAKFDVKKMVVTWLEDD